MAIRLHGKTALVTGAGPNIGREIARTLAAAGARVGCNDIDTSRAEAAAEAVRQTGEQSVAVPADITREEQAERMVEQVVKAFGGLDILVNNAGVTVPRGLLETGLEDWNRVVSVILTGTFLVSRAAARQMVQQGRGGAIVNIASTSGHRGRAGAMAYCAAKGGILNMTRAMAMDLVRYGIRVNSVSPTKTGESVGGLQPAGERFFADIPMGRLGRPSDQARAVLFMASDDAEFITGADLRVDGGSLATWSLLPWKIQELTNPIRS